MIHVFKSKLVIADKEKLTVAVSLADSQSHTIFVFDGVSFRLVKWSLPSNLHVACISLALLSCELDKNASKIKINLTWPHPFHIFEMKIKNWSKYCRKIHVYYENLFCFFSKLRFWTIILSLRGSQSLKIYEVKYESKMFILYNPSWNQRQQFFNISRAV